mmetsp:Transcript_16937/g.54430  ORF Transcript_16937/g.54430 Transcript_16937/m.54430 type:complete len:300 (-) Transcript_16937:962-1861(-)
MAPDHLLVRGAVAASRADPLRRRADAARVGGARAVPPPFPRQLRHLQLRLAARASVGWPGRGRRRCACLRATHRLRGVGRAGQRGGGGHAPRLLPTRLGNRSVQGTLQPEAGAAPTGRRRRFAALALCHLERRRPVPRGGRRGGGAAEAAGGGSGGEAQLLRRKGPLHPQRDGHHLRRRIPLAQHPGRPQALRVSDGRARLLRRGLLWLRLRRRSRPRHRARRPLRCVQGEPRRLGTAVADVRNETAQVRPAGLRHRAGRIAVPPVARRQGAPGARGAGSGGGAAHAEPLGRQWPRRGV